MHHNQHRLWSTDRENTGEWEGVTGSPASMIVTTFKPGLLPHGVQSISRVIVLHCRSNKGLSQFKNKHKPIVCSLDYKWSVGIGQGQVYMWCVSSGQNLLYMWCVGIGQNLYMWHVGIGQGQVCMWHVGIGQGQVYVWRVGIGQGQVYMWRVGTGWCLECVHCGVGVLQGVGVKVS